MKKVFIFFALLVVLAFVILSCSKHNNITPTENNSANSQTSTTSVDSPSIWPTPPPRSVDTKATPRGLDQQYLRIDRNNPVQVAKSFSALSYIVDARTDLSPSDGGKRAAQFADPVLRAKLRIDSPERGDNSWNQLVARDGYTSTQVTINNQDGAPPPTNVKRYISCKVEITAHPQESSSSYVLYMELTKNPQSHNWEVSSYTVTTN